MKLVLFVIFISVAQYTCAKLIIVQNDLSETITLSGFGFPEINLSAQAKFVYQLDSELKYGQVRGHKVGYTGRENFAEFAINIDEGNDSYDISVIEGFHLPITIIPSDENCDTVACLSAECTDAYHFPRDDENVHYCPTAADYTVVFSE